MQPGHIILGGISQGFAVISQVLSSSRSSLVGFVGVWGWLPFEAQLSKVANDDELRVFDENMA